MRARTRAGVFVAIQVTVAVLVGACTGGHATKPPVTVPVGTTLPPSTLPDLSGVALASVPGVTTLTISITPGKATINGTVTDDTGAPVAGAIVNLVRVVGSATASADVAAGADGTFNAPGILGGVYRLRAWRAPDLSLSEAQVFYIGDTDTKTVNLTLQRFTGQQVAASIAPDPPIIGVPAQLAVRVTTSVVGPDGVARGQGQPGVPVELFGSTQWQVNGSPTSVTNSGGTAFWNLTCEELGSQPLSVLVNNTDSVPLNLPACAPVPTTTTTTTPPSTTTIPGHTTTTAKRRATTTTVR